MSSKGNSFFSLVGQLIIFSSSLALIAFLQVGFIFILLALLPTICARFIDRQPGRNIFKTILAANIAGMAPFLTQAFVPNAGSAAMQLAMFKPQIWLSVYGAVAGAVFLIIICRLMCRMSLNLAFRTRVMLLEEAQKKLTEEWGGQIRRG